MSSTKVDIDTDPNNVFVRPDDWPAPEGPIDLAVQDFPHESANTEWWYVNSHVTGADGNDYSFFVSFFRIYKGKDKDGNKLHAHALSAAISDVTNEKYYPIARVDNDSLSVLKFQFDNDMYNIDERLKIAYREVLAKDNIPLPDLPFGKPAIEHKDRFCLEYDENNIFEKLDNGNYHVKVTSPDATVAFDVILKPLKPVQRQGNDGVVQVGIKRESMFYYFIPRNECTGTITIPGKVTDVVSLPGYNVPKELKTVNIKGNAWYDHEFGGSLRGNVYKEEDDEEETVDDADGKPTKKRKKEVKKDDSYAWNWFSIQLDNGTDITATNLIEIETGKVVDNFLITIEEDGKRTEYKDFKVRSENDWISIKTTCIYPLTWHLKSESAGVDITLQAAFANQEIITLIAKPAFWEGRLNVTGTIQGKAVTGKAFTERHGFDGSDPLECFFQRMSIIVRQEIHKVLPYNPSYEQVRALMANEENDHYMHGSSLKVFEDILIKPLRGVIDRGGKAWRSYACLLSIDCVGGDSWDYKHWLSMPELMHVGSLIIDDIQDKSDLRRGHPTCHKIYGEPIAINAGTAAYFLAMDILQSQTPNLSAEMRNKLYELYFLTLRAGHAGQGFDIHGLDYLVPEVVNDDASKQKLIDAITCTHRLKSAVPAGNLARMGTIIGNGTPEQVDAMGKYYEAVGVAFQIIDDVLNLRGSVGKVKAEDLHEGKITYPVARALASMTDKEQRKKFHELLISKSKDEKVVESLLEQMHAVDAIDGAERDASEMVEKAWNALDSHIPDSFFKVMLRAFGFFVLQRHY